MSPHEKPEIEYLEEFGWYQLYVVWVLQRDRTVHLRAICTSEDIAKRYEIGAKQENSTLLVCIDRAATDHMFGTSFRNMIPRTIRRALG